MIIVQHCRDMSRDFLLAMCDEYSDRLILQNQSWCTWHLRRLEPDHDSSSTFRIHKTCQDVFLDRAGPHDVCLWIWWCASFQTKSRTWCGLSLWLYLYTTLLLSAGKFFRESSWGQWSDRWRREPSQVRMRLWTCQDGRRWSANRTEGSRDPGHGVH
jgi:hypothetical protein